MSPRHKSSRDGHGVLIDPIPTPSDMLDDHSLHVKLIDFGHGTFLLSSECILLHMYLISAQKIDERLTNQIQAPSLRAPEVILGFGWDSGVDIWSLGCIVSHSQISAGLAGSLTYHIS